MKDLTEAELIEMERRARSLADLWEDAETVATDVANLCERLRAYTANSRHHTQALLTGFAIGLESK